MYNILVALPYFERLADLNLNFIGDFIKWLVEFSGSIGLGLIIFTVVLKLLTLPLDIYSKAAMRKNSLKMEKMRPQLEKLKKNYAHDKAIYNQKMMALYKKEGYSMFGACLPTIVTLVFFIIVLRAFQDYSKHETLKVFNDMRDSYTQVIEDYAGSDYTLQQNEITALKDSGKIEQDNEDSAVEYIKNQARQASADIFKSKNAGFLWVKNIWISDSALSHPVQKYSKFLSTIELTNDDNFSEEAYNELTYNLSEEKSQPNGFFIFIVLSIGVTLLSQLVLGKSQKAQLELQSVDGQGMQTQKMMMYILPVMIGVFAFLYTSAFCIYMITNSVLTIGLTLLINMIVDNKFKKREQKMLQEKTDKRFVKKEYRK